MELTPEIDQLFASESERIALLELTYKNGGMVLGTIRRLRLRPLRIVVQKSEPGKGERPKHKVVFEHVIRLRIIFQDGSELIFPA